MLVLGDREVEARSATLRRRGAARDAAQETMGWNELAEQLAAEVAARRVE
jgi:threonyl-tRNA synthetase